LEVGVSTLRRGGRQIVRQTTGPFPGEPACVALGNDIWTITEEIWNALDPDNRISLLVRTIDLREGKVENRILNANT